MTFSLPSTSCLLKLPFKKLRRPLQRERLITEIELCVWFSVLRLFHVGHVVRIDEVHIRLLVTNVFHVTAENERLGSLSKYDVDGSENVI